MIRHPRRFFILLCALVFSTSVAVGDAFDPPAAYYNAATGTGATLKSQLHTIITTGNTPLSYDSARSSLQVTDADPASPGRMITAYDRISVNVAAINPGGPIPGWDSGTTWNREHTWPRSRGIDSSGPDDSDLFNLRPSLTANNGDRGNLNFGGVFGAQSWGVVTDGGPMYWYPGDADAGMIARQEFYMAVRFDGTEASTTNLELFAGNPSTSQGLGNLTRLIEWHFAAPPDSFERRRNQIIFDNYQHNRDPFIDHPEWVWSVFVGQNNNSQISLAGTTVGSDGASTRNVDLGRVYVGGAVPGNQSLALNKTGNDGTYFEVTTAGAATSSISGRLNAFRTGVTGSKAINVGLNTTTATSGIKSGTVTINNLDVTTGGGAGHGANDANDTIQLSLAVLDHPIASYSHNIDQRSEIIDFGIIPLGSGPSIGGASIVNFAAGGAPAFAADLDLDSIEGIGDVSVLQLNLSAFAALAQGELVEFSPSFLPTSIGQFSADYTLYLSDEDLPGEQMQTLTFSLIGEAILAGDYNRDGLVDAADYVVWRHTLSESVAAYAGADGNGDTMIDENDFLVWQAHFGDVAPDLGAGSASHALVPEPGGLPMGCCGFAVIGLLLCVRTRGNSECRLIK